MIKNITRREIMIGIVLFFAALFLRTYNLNSLPVFGDEAIYIHWAQTMWKDANFRFLPLSDGKQPLFMWIMIPFLKFVSDPLVAGRLVSIMSGLGTLIGITLLTQLLFKTLKISLLAGLLYTLTPFSVFFDRLALADSLLSMFGVWTFALSLSAVKYKRFDFSMLAGFALGGAFLTKSPALFYAILLPTVVFLANTKKEQLKIETLALGVIYIIPTYVIGYGLSNILRLGPQFHMLAIRNKDYVYPISHILTSPLDPLFPFLDRSLEYFWILGPSVVVILFLFGLYLGFKYFRKETLVVFLWSMLPLFAVAEFQRVMTARYIYFTLPYFLIISALVGISVLEKQKATITQPVTILTRVFIVIFIVQSLYNNFWLLVNPAKTPLPRTERSGYLEEWTSGYGLKAVSEYLISNYANSERDVHVGTEGYFGTLPDGLQIYLQNYPHIKVYGVGLDFDSVPDDLKSMVNEGKKTYFVANSDRLKFDHQSDSSLIVINSYPKAQRPEGSNQLLYFFQLD